MYQTDLSRKGFLEIWQPRRAGFHGGHMATRFCMGQGQLHAASLFMRYSHKKVLLFRPGMRLMAQLALNVPVEVVQVFLFFSFLPKEKP